MQRAPYPRFAQCTAAAGLVAVLALLGCGSSKSSAADDDGGSGGTGGTGGTSGMGGTGAMGGSAGNAGESPQISLTVTYDNALTRTLRRCNRCEATYFPDLDTAVALFVVEEGNTTFDLRFEPEPAASGYRVQALFVETSLAVPLEYRGEYTEPLSFQSGDAVPVADSCVDFSALEMRAGGRLAGSLDCSFRGPATALIKGSFSATWVTPPQ